MMILTFILGVVAGAVGYFIYETYGSKVYGLGRSLLTAAEGDLAKAKAHIASLKHVD